MNALAKQTTAYQDQFPSYKPVDASVSLLSMNNRRVRVPEHKSEWVRALEGRLGEVTSLNNGWDGYNGIAVTFFCAQFAANLIERLYVKGVKSPQLVPGSDGTIQLEWHENGYDLEIDILAPYKVIANFYDIISDDRQEIEVDTDFTKLAEWVHKISEKRLGCCVGIR